MNIKLVRRMSEDAKTLFEALRLADEKQYGHIIELYSAKNDMVHPLSVVTFVRLVDDLVKMNMRVGTKAFPNRDIFTSRTQSVKEMLDGILPIYFLEEYPISLKEYTLIRWEGSKHTFLFFIFATFLFGATVGIEYGELMFLIILALLGNLHLSMYGTIVAARKWHAENLLRKALWLDKVFAGLRSKDAANAL